VPKGGCRSLRFLPAGGIDGAYLIELEPYEDDRGLFARVWCRDELAEHGLNPELAQASISRNTRVGTLRGMHFQRPPHEEAKLVRCTRGAIFDVVLDLRPGSTTRCQWFGVELDSTRGSALYVPEGCAHGFQTLIDDTEVLYLISHPYEPEAAAGVRWDDRAFGIEWPDTRQRTISERDLSWPDFEVDR
jgi:dTDP-4-dehydrorhamnose 3,5-epimerase